MSLGFIEIPGDLESANGKKRITKRRVDVNIDNNKV